MKVIYTNNPRPPKENEVFRTLSQFFGVVIGTTEVVIEGEAPHIEQAYRDLGFDVEVVDADVNKQEIDPADMGLPALRKHLKALDVEFDPKATKDELLALLPPKE